MDITIDMARMEAVMLAALRMTAFLVIAPPFSYQAFPLRVKAMLGIGLGLAVSPVVTPGYELLDTGPFIAALILEVSTGAVLGFLVFIAFAAVQSAGNLIDLFSGFQLAQVYDPQSMVNGAQFTKLFQMTALALLFASDGYQIILGGLVRSFNGLPVGTGVDTAVTSELIITGVTQMFISAVQIAGPLLVVLFLADAGLGLLTRVAPQLNAFSLGFPLKILITLSLAATLFIALPRVVSALVQVAARMMLGVQ